MSLDRHVSWYRTVTGAHLLFPIPPDRLPSYGRNSIANETKRHVAQVVESDVKDV